MALLAIPRTFFLLAIGHPLPTLACMEEAPAACLLEQVVGDSVDDCSRSLFEEAAIVAEVTVMNSPGEAQPGKSMPGTMRIEQVMKGNERTGTILAFENPPCVYTSYQAGRRGIVAMYESPLVLRYPFLSASVMLSLEKQGLGTWNPELMVRLRRRK